MPNWVEQDLHVVGRKADIDRFIRTGFRRRIGLLRDDVLVFPILCPLKRREPRTTYTPDSGVVLFHYRTRTQACFSMITGWDYPAEFYARLPQHWPQLSFVCSVNEDMGGFGGIVMVLDGEVTNLVREYGTQDYNRRRHARQVRAAITRWAKVTGGGRDWRVVPHHAWDHGRMPFDAHFDDDFWFYFKSREEMIQFRKRYRTSRPQRRVNGEWKRTR